MAEVKDTLLINIRIGSMPFPIEIPREKEEIYRAAEKMANADLIQYQNHYKNLKMEQYMAMALLDLASRLYLCEQKNDTTPFVNAMNELSEEIAGAFSQE